VSAILAGKAEKAFLEQVGLSIGCQIEVLASQQDEAYLIKCGDNVPVNLTKELAQKILVKPEI